MHPQFDTVAQASLTPGWDWADGRRLQGVISNYDTDFVCAADESAPPNFVAWILSARKNSKKAKRPPLPCA